MPYALLHVLTRRENITVALYKYWNRSASSPRIHHQASSSNYFYLILLLIRFFRLFSNSSLVTTRCAPLTLLLGHGHFVWASEFMLKATLTVQMGGVLSRCSPRLLLASSLSPLAPFSPPTRCLLSVALPLRLPMRLPRWSLISP